MIYPNKDSNIRIYTFAPQKGELVDQGYVTVDRNTQDGTVYSAGLTKDGQNIVLSLYSSPTSEMEQW